MNHIKSQDSGTIRVADITIGQLSRGLYRSTATAFKELVSNAYDADASIVRIDTNYPEFDFLSCVDDGTGMPLEEFLRYFSHEGIGSCIKRKQKRDITDIYKRPIIGRLGIGMLAIGQLCHSFEIESHYIDKNKTGKAYHGTVVLEDISIPDKEEIIRNADTKTKEMEVGTWKYESIDYDETKGGFRVYSSDVRKTFRHEMKSSIGKREHKQLSFSFSDLHSKFYDKSKKSIRDCKPYLETIWELAILCPLPYYGKIEKYPVNLNFFASKEFKECKQAIQFIQERQNQFLNEKFRIIFDGIELKRHIQLPTEKDVLPKLYFIEFDDIVFESRLRFSGYFFAQIPRAVRPLELNGVQIRLRGVGIGGYDSTFLKYYKEIETIRSRWVSGEVFVDEGLELALNIDRDSFNEHDEHYKKLQTILHDRLDKIFNEISGISKNIHEVERGKTRKKLFEDLNDVVVKESKGKFRIVQSALGKDAPTVTVDPKRGKIIMNIDARPLKKKKANTIYQAIELAYQVAENMAKTEKEKHDIFSQLIKEILINLI